MLAITPAESKRASWLALLFALALHLAFIAIAARIHRARPVHAPPLVTEMFEIEAPPPAPSLPMPEPEPAPIASTPREHTAPRAPRTAPSPAPPSPAPAPSGTSDVLDFGSTLVTSTASSSSFAARGAAHGPSRATATARSSTTGAGTSDLSRAPALAGTTEWRCPFPLGADDAGIDHAVVTLRVDVADDGTALGAHVLDDPGHGFGQNARACALRKRFAPALDRQGAPQRAKATVQVTFDR